MQRSILTSLLLLPLAGGAVPAVNQPQAPPSDAVNVLFVMTDQHNPRMIGGDSNGYGGLSTSLTPHLDELAAEGVRFPRSYCASPQCMPSRFSLLTGLHTHRHGLRVNKIWEPAGETTWVELARAQGYRTGIFGKHHLEWLDHPEALDDHGFQEVADMEDYDAWCQANGYKRFDHPAVVTTMPNLPKTMTLVGHTSTPNFRHPTGWFSDRMIRFLEERSVDGEPFAAWLSFYGPHTPILPSNAADPGDWAHSEFPYQALALPPNQAKVSALRRVSKTQNLYAAMTDEQHREVLAYYYGYVRQIDHNIGRVLDRLQQLGLEDNTLVVFTSDHGECGGEMDCWTKGIGCYDCVTRVPLVMRLPDVLPAGHVSEVVASGVDVFPTVSELCGFTPTEAVRRNVDGRSLVGPMRSQAVPAGWAQRAFVQFGQAGHSTGRHRLVATPVDKLNFDEYKGPFEEYYDLVSDPWELINRVDDPTYAHRVLFLRTLLWHWWGNEDDHAPEYGITGNETSRPAQVREPFPADGATGVPTDVDLGWVPSTAATWHDVFLGTTPGNMTLFRSLRGLVDGANLGTLAPGQTYYWAVRGRNALSADMGPTWSFSTDPAGASGPGLATGPSPASSAEEVGYAPLLTWTPPSAIVQQSVWFGEQGKDLELVAVGDGSLTSYQAPQGFGGSTYEWRVDTTSAQGTTEGDRWTFRLTEAGLPERALAPNPAHLAEVPAWAPKERLRWQPVTGATQYLVRFGKHHPLPVVSAQTGTSWAPGVLDPGQAYFWRVDCVNTFGVTPGTTWRFEVH